MSDMNKIFNNSAKDEKWIQKRLNRIKNRKTLVEKDTDVIRILSTATQEYIDSLKWTINKIQDFGDIGQQRFANYVPMLEGQISLLNKFMHSIG